MNTTRKIRQYQTSHWLIFFIMLFSTIVIHYLYREKIQTYSMNKLEKYLSTLDQYKIFHIFANYFGSFGNELIISIFLILVYNFGNIFKFIILLTSLQVSLFIISIFQLIYCSNTPVLNHYSIKLYSDYLIFGDPSTRIFLSTVFYLALHRITFRSSSFDERRYIKVIGFMFTLFFIFILSILTWITGMNSMEQILFGFTLGFSVYFFYFFVLNINSNKSKQLQKLTIFPIYYYFLITISIIVGYLLLFFILKDDILLHQKLATLEQKQMSINKHLSFYNGSKILFIVSLSIIGTILGLKAEFTVLFERNYLNWRQYNFEKDDEKNDEDSSLCSKLCINKDIQWNHTSLCISSIRLIFICLFLFLFILPYKYLNFQINNFIFSCQVFFIANSICFGLCFFYKQLLKWFKLTNITLFTIIRESI